MHNIMIIFNVKYNSAYFNKIFKFYSAVKPFKENEVIINTNF